MNSKKTVLITDDSKLNQDIITDILGDQYHYLYADNGVELIDMLNNGVEADIILLDINMPLMDGFAVLEIMNERHWLEETPVVVISAENDHDFLQKAYSLGATDYIPRPFSAVAVRFRVKNTLMLYTKQRQLVQLVEEQVYAREEVNDTMINIFSRAIELQNNESGKHTLNIRNISDVLLRRLVHLSDQYRLSEREIAEIVSLSSLHDIGKIAIPKEILNKPGKLTPEERKIMETHTTEGDAIVGSAATVQGSDVVKTAREICRWHHERWDGKGYPDGLAGDEIPISAQVVSLADVYDALTSERCYKKAFSHEQAIDMICNGECGTFNPLLIRCLCDVAPKLLEITKQSQKKYDYTEEVQALALETLNNRELPLDDRARRLLQNEKEKKEFFKTQAGGIQFEFDCPAQKVMFENRCGKEPEVEVFYLAQGDNVHLLSKEDWNTLRDKLRKTSRDNRDVTMTVLIPINGEYRWHRLNARSIWPQRGDEYISVLGQFTDIHDEITKSGTAALFRDQDGIDAAFDLLKKIFEVVRLVDPTDNSVLRITKDGKLVKTPAKCYELWNRGECCENCSSSEAYRCRGLMTKLETKNGELYSVISKYLKLHGDTDCVLEIAFDLSEEKTGKDTPKLPERTRLLLLDFYKDSLTDTYSRMYLEDFKSGLENADAVAVVDIDGFKQINDTYGHPVGDTALKHIAGIIESAVGQKGVVIRYGGDEFLLIFNGVTEYEFKNLLKTIKESVHASVLPEAPDLRLAVSIGGAYREESLAQAISNADKEMYKDKSNHRTER